MTKKEHENIMMLITMTHQTLSLADTVSEKNPAYKQFRDDVFNAWILLNKTINEEVEKALKQGR